MNDPGLDEPAGAAAQDVNDTVHNEDEQAEQEEREYLDPSYVAQYPGIVLRTLTNSVNGGLPPRRVPSLQEHSAPSPTASPSALSLKNGEFTFRLEATRDTDQRSPIQNGLSRSIQSRSSSR